MSQITGFTDLDPALRRFAIDAIAERNADATPSAVQDKRRSPRLTIAEMNSLSIDDLRDRMKAVKGDYRTPLTRFLDTLDLPRNFVVSHVFPGLERKARERGEVGALGYGRVTGSDIVGALGVDNRIARGVLGFGLDLVTDPLTYVGAGPVVKLADAGRAVQISKAGSRALRSGIEAASIGEKVVNPEVARVIEASGYSASRIEKMRRAAAARGEGDDLVRSTISKRLLGDAADKRAALQLKKLDTAPVRGGTVARDFFGEIASDTPDLVRNRVEASREFVKRYGKKPGTEIAHVPFSDRFTDRGIGLSVPAFTSGGRLASAAAAIAKAGEYAGKSGEPIGAAPHAVMDLARKQESLVGEISSLTRRIAEIDDNAAITGGVLGPIEAAEREAASKSLESAHAQMKANYNAVIDEVSKASPLGDIDSVAKAIAQSKALEKAEAARNLIDTRLATLEHDRMFRRQFDTRARGAAREMAARLGGGRAYTDPLEVGNRVLATDRNNWGKVVSVNPDGSANVYFKNPDTGAEATVSMARDKLVKQLDASASSVSEKQIENLRNAMIADEARLREGGDRILAMPAEELDNTIEAVRHSLHAADNYADTLKASLRSVYTSAERDLVDAAKLMLREGDDQIAHSMIVGPARSVERTLADRGVPASFLTTAAARASDAKHSVFGRRGGGVHRYFRNVKWADTHGAAFAANERINTIKGQIDEVMKRHDVADYDYDAVANVIGAMAIAHRAAGKRGFHDVAWTRLAGGGIQETSASFQRAIQEAVASGLLDENLPGRKGIREALSNIAKQNLDMLDEFGSSGVSDEILDAARESYIPNTITREAQAMAEQAEKILGLGPAQSGQKGGLSEAFQKERSTDQFRFELPGGKKGKFYDFERAYVNIPEKSLDWLKRANPAAYRHIDDVRNTIAEYDNLVKSSGMSPEEADLVFRRATDHLEINEELGNGLFATLVGKSNLPRKFFESNIALIMAGRQAAQQRAVAKASLFDRVGQHMVKISNEVMKARTNIPDGGMSYTLKGGTPIRIVNEPGAPQGMIAYIGNERYRFLDQKKYTGYAARALFNPVADDGGHFLHLVPEPLAQALDRAAEVFAKPGVIGSTVNELTQMWKGSTLFHPSWMLNDLVGGAILAIYGGAKPGTMISNAKAILKTVLHQDDPAKLAGITFNFGGRKLTAQEFIDTARRNGVLNSNRFSEPWFELSALGYLRFPNEENFLLNPAAAVKESWQKALENAGVAGAVRNAPFGAKLKAIKGFAYDEMVAKRVLSPWYKANEKANDWTRLMAFASHLDDGHGPAEAAANVIESMFDYGDFTRAEDYMRRYVFPFFSWIRNNGAYQLANVVQNPKYAAAFPKLRTALEEMLVGEEAVPLHMRPNWMRDQLAIQVGTDPETRSAVLSLSSLPQEQLYNVGAAAMGPEGFASFLKYIGSSTNPVFRVPTELAFGQELYTGRKIGFGDGGDIQWPAYIASQIRPLREFGVLDVRKGPVPRAFSKGVGQGVSRLTTGGKYQPFDKDVVDRDYARRFKEKEDAYRRSLSVAEFNGRQDASLESRAKLMVLYQSALRDGRDDLVPKWAQAQLEGLSPGG